MALSDNQNPEGYEKDEIETHVEKDHSHDALVPRWLKTAGALVGIVVALVTAFLGIYQVAVSLKQIDVNIQKEQRLAEEAKAREAEENRKKAEVEKQQSAAEAEARLNLKDKDLEIRVADLQKETLAKETLQLSIRKEFDTKNLEEEFKLKAEERAEKKEEVAKVNDALLGVFQASPVPNLARLAKYAVPGDERLPSILTSLVAKLDQARDPSEVSIVFQLFERMGPVALGSVIDSNRNAFERYKSDCKKLALIQFNAERKNLLMERPPEVIGPVNLTELFDRSTATLMSTQDSNTALGALQRSYIEDVWEQITRSLTGRTYRDSRTRASVPPVQAESLATLELSVTAKDGELCREDISLQLAILRHSKRSLSRLLKQTQEFVDLSGADLSGLRLLPAAYGPINFSEALVTGADFSDAKLNQETLDSLAEAYVARDQKARTHARPSNLGLTNSQGLRVTRPGQ